MEQNRKAGQNPPRVVAPTEEEEELCDMIEFRTFRILTTSKKRNPHLWKKSRILKRILTLDLKVCKDGNSEIEA